MKITTIRTPEGDTLVSARYRVEDQEIESIFELIEPESLLSQEVKVLYHVSTTDRDWRVPVILDRKIMRKVAQEVTNHIGEIEADAMAGLI